MPKKPTRSKTYWDPVAEKIAVLELGDLQEEKAGIERIKTVDIYKGDAGDFLDQANFYVRLTTTHQRTPREYKISMFNYQLPHMYVGVYAARLYGHIREMFTNVWKDYPYLDESDKNDVIKKFLSIATGYFLYKEVPPKPEPIIDLRPYVFLRFLLLIPIIPEEILHAIYVQEEAMKSQQLIIKETERIKKLNNEHYKQYGNLLEKSKAYLSNFFK